MILRLLAAALFCAPSGILASTRTDTLSEPTEIQGVPCQKGKVGFFGDGRLRHAALSRDWTMGGVVWPSGSEVTLRAEGQLQRCWTSRETITASGFTLPAGTEVWAFYTDGEPCACCLLREAVFAGLQLPLHSSVFLPRQSSTGRGWRLWPSRDVTIQGHVCHQIDGGSGHMFFRDGKLRAIWVLGVEGIDGVPCTSIAEGMAMRVSFYGSDRMAWFYENGHLQQGMLAQDATIQGHALKKGDLVTLSPDGKVDLTARSFGRAAILRDEGGNLADILTVLRERNKSRAGAGEVEAAPLAEGIRANESLKNMGQASPVKAVETVNWASWRGEIETLAGMIVFDASGESAARALFASLKPGVKAQLKSPERMMAVLIEYGYPTGRGYRVLGEHGIFFASGVRIVRCELQTSRAGPSWVTYRMQRIDGKWMLEVNQGNVFELSDLLIVEGAMPPPEDY